MHSKPLKNYFLKFLTKNFEFCVSYEGAKIKKRIFLENYLMHFNISLEFVKKTNKEIPAKFFKFVFFKIPKNFHSEI